MVNQSNTRTVRYFASQNAEDLYQCEETGGVYIRQKCDERYVRWLTASKWQGGYEADCSLREGIIIHAVNRSGSVLFREETIKVDGYMDADAEKAGAFSGDAIIALAEDIRKRFDLETYEEWKDWLMREAAAAGFEGYDDNWLYDNEYEKPEKIAKMDFLGVSVYAVAQRAKHRRCGKKWTGYEIRTADLSTCVAICGFDIRGEW